MAGVSSVDQLVKESFQMTQNMFVGHHYAPNIPIDPVSHQLKIRTKLDSEFGHVKDLSLPVVSQAESKEQEDVEMVPVAPPTNAPITPESAVGKGPTANSNALALSNSSANKALSVPSHRRAPDWHAPWEIMRV